MMLCDIFARVAAALSSACRQLSGCGLKGNLCGYCEDNTSLSWILHSETAIYPATDPTAMVADTQTSLRLAIGLLVSVSPSHNIRTRTAH